MKKVYILSILMAVVVGISVYLFATSLKQDEQPQTVLTKAVVVAVTDIPANTQLTADMLTVTELPAVSVNILAASSLTEAVGKITRYPIAAQEQVFPTRLYGDGDTDASLSYTLEEGQRAMSIGVDDVTGVSGYITQGDYVDVVATLDLTGSQVTGQSTSMLLVENLLVLETGVMQQSAADSTSQTYATITLSVTPEQALKINYAADNGRIRLVLRPVLDNQVVNAPDYPPASAFTQDDTPDESATATAAP